jgi:hypothetical protein
VGGVRAPGDAVVLVLPRHHAFFNRSTKSIPFLLVLIADVSNDLQFSKMLNYLKLERAKVVSFAVFVVGWT